MRSIIKLLPALALCKQYDLAGIGVMARNSMNICRSLAAAVALAGAAQIPASAQQPSAADFDQIAAAQTAANSKPGPRVSPERTLSVPTADVSSEMQAAIAAPY
eukprot:gene5170-6850_t